MILKSGVLEIGDRENPISKNSHKGTPVQGTKVHQESIYFTISSALFFIKHFSFLDFRDYFAALHVLHEAEMGVKRGEVADVLKERALPVYIRRFMGEIEGEHYQRPVFQEGKGWLEKEDRTSLLNRVLDLCRGVFGWGYGVWSMEYY